MSASYTCARCGAVLAIITRPGDWSEESYDAETDYRYRVEWHESGACTPTPTAVEQYAADVILADYGDTLAAVRHEAGIRRRFLDGAPDTWTALALAGACRTVEARLTAAGVS